MFICAVRRSLAARWNMPTELAVDLAALSLYDIIIYAGVTGLYRRWRCICHGCRLADVCGSIHCGPSHHAQHTMQAAGNSQAQALVFGADDSTSMKYADKGERIDDLRLILERVAEVQGC